MADIDWNRWLPPAPLPDTGRKDFKPGQVWAVRTDYGQPGVFLVNTLHSDSAAGGVDSTDRLAGDCENWHPAPSSPNAEQAVLVQDVGQPEPTPPEVLYGFTGYARVDLARGGSGLIRANHVALMPDGRLEVAYTKP